MSEQILNKAGVKIDDEGLSFSVPIVNSEKNLPVRIDFGSSAIFIGANGSGKTRLSVFLESDFPQENILRLLAQRSVSLPEDIQMMTEEQARFSTTYGKNNLHNKEYFKKNFSFKEGKFRYQYNEKPATAFLNDYEALLQILFSEEGNLSSEHRKGCIKAIDLGKSQPHPPRSKLDKVIEIWQKILPRRALRYGNWTLKTYNPEDEKNEYSSSEMSDGEREVFYLTGKCMLAHKNSLIIVDEPELHLNPAIVSSLWTEIEKARPDCAFLYITHDFNFSFSRLNTQKFALRSYQNMPSEKWEIKKIPDETGLPEELLLQLIGSRKKILLVEGKKEKSWDNLIYSAVYPEWHVISVGSCSQLEHYVKSLKAPEISQLHRYECKGIIDRDRRFDPEIRKLKEKGIEVLEFMDIENIFLMKDVFEVLLDVCSDISDQTDDGKRDKRYKLSKLDEFFFKKIKGQIETLIKDYSKQKISDDLKAVLAGKSTNWADQIKEVSESVENIKNTQRQRIEEALESENYDELCKLCDGKELWRELVEKNLDEKNLMERMKRIFSRPDTDERRQKLVEAFRKHLPKL